jgi:glycerophosphoryl diester phosphodiesterase
VDRRPLVIAHRGASAAFPENTVEAFEGARDLGADWVELDVRRTKDGRLSIHHDATLADGRVIVELTSRELPRSVPWLGQALDACAGMGVNIEIKNWPGDPDFDPERSAATGVAALVAARDERSRVLVSSFDMETIDRVRALDAGIETAFLTSNLDDVDAVVAQCVEKGHAALHPWVPTVDAAIVDACHAAGLRVNTWTVDDPDWIARLVAMGVDGIVTNVPDVARRVVDGGG